MYLAPQAPGYSIFFPLHSQTKDYLSKKKFCPRLPFTLRRATSRSAVSEVLFLMVIVSLGSSTVLACKGMVVQQIVCAGHYQPEQCSPQYFYYGSLKDDANIVLANEKVLLTGLITTITTLFVYRWLRLWKNRCLSILSWSLKLFWCRCYCKHFSRKIHFCWVLLAECLLPINTITTSFLRLRFAGLFESMRRSTRSPIQQSLILGRVLIHHQVALLLNWLHLFDSDITHNSEAVRVPNTAGWPLPYCTDERQYWWFIIHLGFISGRPATTVARDDNAMERRRIQLLLSAFALSKLVLHAKVEVQPNPSYYFV